MTKSQMYVLGASALLIVVLLFLPKSVVKNRSAVAEVRSSNGMKDSKKEDTHSDSSHHTTIPKDEQLIIAHLIRKFESARSAPEKEQFFDSLVNQYRRFNYYDSAAIWAEKLQILLPSATHERKAAEMWYEAFEFAVESSRKKEFAEKARKLLEKISIESPTDLDLAVKVGMTYMVSEQPMQGIQKIRAVLEKNPTHRRAIFSLGILSMQSGQYDKALERFEQLIKLNEADGEAYLYKGKTLYEMGKIKEASSAFQKALELTEEPLVKANLKSLLQELK